MPRSALWGRHLRHPFLGREGGGQSFHPTAARLHPLRWCPPPNGGHSSLALQLVGATPGKRGPRPSINLASWKLNWTDGFTQGKSKAQRHKLRQKNVF